MKKSKILSLVKAEEKMLKHEEIETRHIYQKLLEIEELLKRRAVTKFTDVIEWRRGVWEYCKYKKEKATKNEIVFYCTKTKKLCHFVGCPENVA